MGDSWSRDMQNDGVPEEKVLELVAKSMKAARDRSIELA